MLQVEGELGWPRGAAVDLQSLPDRGLERAEKPELEDPRRHLGGATLGFACPGQNRKHYMAGTTPGGIRGRSGE